MRPLVGIHTSAKEADWLAGLSNHADMVDLVTGISVAKLAAAVTYVDERDARTFLELRDLRMEYADTSLIVVASMLSANLAVELVKLGVADCLCIPSQPYVLWRKIERSILHSGGPAIDSPLLALLWDAKKFPRHEEKRRCFRSETIADYPAYVTPVSPVMLPKMLVKNLSILTEGCPGGVALIGTNVHIHALTKSPTFRAVLEVPQFTKPIPTQCTVMRILSTPTTGDPAAIIGVEYRIDDPAHEGPMRRFWSESQRRIAAVAREAARED